MKEKHSRYTGKLCIYTVGKDEINGQLFISMVCDTKLMFRDFFV